MSARPQHRRLIVLRGAVEQTREAALALISSISHDRALWVSDLSGERVRGESYVSRVESYAQRARPREVRSLLGRSFEVVVLALHERLDAESLGQAQGLVWGGGALILRRPLIDRDETTLLLEERWERALSECASEPLFEEITLAPPSSVSALPAPLKLTLHRASATREQDEVVEALEALLVSARPERATLIADRGRGKSSALGRAARRALNAHPHLQIAVTASQELAAREVTRFANQDKPNQSASSMSATSHAVPFIELRELIWGEVRSLDAILVDEAAQLPVPILQRLTERYATTTLIFATTTRGYEGTGRGFLLRFLTWLETRPEGLKRYRLSEPIRWAPQDPLESLISSALLFDAEPHTPSISAFSLTPERLISEVEHVIYRDRGVLAADEQTLRGIFGLLVHAHYRTTPRDLEHLLDAPNVEVHALLWRGDVVAATLIAREGQLEDELCEALYWGETRVRGHALADVFISHLGAQESGALEMIRSVRIATHPDLRRRGLASALIERVHASYQPDLFGTLFGVTEGLLDFRRQAGYELAWVSASRGSRTGEPAALMLSPRSDRAWTLLRRLRAQLARDLPLQLELFTAGRQLLLSERLRERLMRGLSERPPQLSHQAHMKRVEAYLHGPRTFESSVSDIVRFTRSRETQLCGLSDAARALIESRVLAGEPWEVAMRRAGLPSLSATMRGLRLALRELSERG